MLQVTRKIMLTAGHTQSAATSSDDDYFLDFDLSILGAHANRCTRQVLRSNRRVGLLLSGQPESVYDKYARDVRQEYGQFPDVIFNAGRAQARARWGFLLLVLVAAHRRLE